MAALQSAAGNDEVDYSEHKYMAVQRLRKLFEGAKQRDVLAKNKIDEVSMGELKDMGIRSFHIEIIKGVGSQAKALHKYIDRQKKAMQAAGISTSNAFLRIDTKKIIEETNNLEDLTSGNVGAPAAASNSAVSQEEERQRQQREVQDKAAMDLNRMKMEQELAMQKQKMEMEMQMNKMQLDMQK